MDAGAEFELVDLTSIGRTRVQLALTDRPWLLPSSTLVLPASRTGRLGSLGQAFRGACADQWQTIQKDIDAGIAAREGIRIEQPLFVKLHSTISVAPQLRHLVLATSEVGDRHHPDVAVKAILRLADENGLKELVLPLIGSGAQGEPPRETAVATLSTIIGSGSQVERVVLATLSAEARQWLTAQASALRAPPSSSRESSTHFSGGPTASSLLVQGLESLGKSPSAALAELFAISGRLAAQRRTDNGLLTTSLILFAAIWMGTKRNPEDPESVFLSRLSDKVSERAGEDYDQLLKEYFSEPPNYLPSEGEPAVASLSNNVRALLRRSAGKADSTRLAAPPCILALLDMPGANAINNLKKIGLEVATLREQLEKEWISLGPAAGPDLSGSSAHVAETSPSESEPTGQYIPIVNNDTANVEGADLLAIEDEVEAFARLAASRAAPPPLSIGVFGDWGAGKSFFMERMFAKIERIKNDKQHQESPTFYTDIVQIRFNAWHYIETNLWASLVEFIFSELDRWLRLKKEAQGPQVDALFERLSTSRELRLDSYRELMARRRDLHTAEKELEAARKQNEEALKSAEARPLEDPWTVVVKGFLQNADAGEKKKIEEAVDSLGLHQLGVQSTASAQELAALVEGTRVQAVRTQTLANALIARLGTRSGAVIAAGAVLGAPLLMALVLSVLDAGAVRQSLGKLSATMLQFVSAASAMIAVAGFWLEKARSGLDRIEGLRSKLDEQVAQRTATERNKLADAQLAAERARQAIADAEKRVAAAKDRELAAKQDFANETTQGRINRFIRGKVADAAYAKHLGIIASIRKDFGQLTDLMQAGNNDQSLRDEIRKSSQQYLKKIEELINDPSALLEQEEIDDLKATRGAIQLELEGKSKPDLPSFERIILYIDDLDRCPPDKVVEVLQAIHLFLYFPLFVVVVAVDARWVSRSLMVRYKELLSDDRTAAIQVGKADTPPAAKRPADAQDYLEKLFQLPYWVRRMDPAASKKFVQGLAEAFVKAGTSGPDSERSVALPQPQQEQAPSQSELSINTENPEARIDQPNGRATDHRLTEAVASPGSRTADERALTFIPMTLSVDEQGDLAAFAAFAGSSPRRAKRYLNLYLLLKTSLKPGAGAPGMNRRVNQRAIIALLAIVTAAGPSDPVFERLADEKPEFQDVPSLLRLLEKGSGGPSTNTCNILSKLIEVSQPTSLKQSAQMIAALRHFAQAVRRYSF